MEHKWFNQCLFNISVDQSSMLSVFLANVNDCGFSFSQLKIRGR